MVLHFNSHQRLSSSPSRGDIHPKSQLSFSRLVHGPIRTALRRFPQTSSTLAPLPLISFAFLLSLMVPPPNSGAQSADTENTAPPNLNQLSLEQLGNLEVTTVSKEPEEIQRTPAAIYVLTHEDSRRSGATSIPEVLRLVPGVEVAQIDSSTWAVGIRGFGNSFSKSVLVLIDGRNVYTPLFAGVDWKLQNVMIEDVERIEVIRGPGRTIWGTNAVNGVINIITKNSKDTQGTLVSVGGGNVDQGTGEFRQGGKFGRNINYRVYGMAFGRGPQFHSDHDNFDDWQLGKGGFRMDWDNRGSDSFTVQGDLYKGGVGQRENLAKLPVIKIVVIAVELWPASEGHSINTVVDVSPKFPSLPKFTCALIDVAAANGNQCSLGVFGILGDDVDHPVHGIRSPDGSPWSTNDFDALHVLDHHVL